MSGATDVRTARAGDVVRHRLREAVGEVVEVRPIGTSIFVVVAWSSWSGDEPHAITPARDLAWAILDATGGRE